MEIMDVMLVRTIDRYDSQVEEVPDCETGQVVLESVGEIEED
jgi:hypothetical protein